MTDGSRRVGRRGSGEAPTSPRLFATNRLEAFSDGVFAIVVTLLVLELEVPGADANLSRELAQSWPAFLGYIVSFAFIGAAWIAHSGLTRLIKAADGILMRLNLLLLLFVSFLPFTTNLMATNLNDSQEDLAVVLFGLNLTLAALMASVLAGHAARTPGLAGDDVAEVELQTFRKERRVAVILQAAATVVGLFLPVIAVMTFLAISVLLLVEPLWRTRQPRTRRRLPDAATSEGGAQP